MFTSPRIARPGDPGDSRSFDSPPKSTRQKQWKRSTGERSLAVPCASISPRTARAKIGPGETSGHQETAVAVAATTIAAAAVAATVGTTTAVASKSPSEQRAAGVVSEARSEASDQERWRSRPKDNGLKNLGRGVNPARVPVVLYPQGV